MEPNEELILPDILAWRAWLDENEETSDGVWLVVAKKGTTSPTSLTVKQALPEALCSGWIDAIRRKRDATTFLQRYTPRRKTSVWSKINTELAEALISEGRMRTRGLTEVQKAKDDGRWERAYHGQATAQVPADLQQALDLSPAAASAFTALKSQPRYHILHQLMIARTDKTRSARLRRFVDELEKAAEK